jgi:hypothetical protein
MNMRYPSAPYFYSARFLSEADWKTKNEIALRSNWRELLDACLEEGDEATANELRNYDVWATCEYELEKCNLL